MRYADLTDFASVSFILELLSNLMIIIDIAKIELINATVNCLLCSFSIRIFFTN